jgi:glucose-6-phosphate isomerase
MINTLLFNSHNEQNKKNKQNLYNKINNEVEKIGFYNLPDLPESELNKYTEYSKKIAKKNIVVVGIGGSSLGTFAIHEFLKHSATYDKKLHFMDTTDPITIETILQKIDLNNSLFIVISKSGTTTETLSVFKILLNILPLNNENYLIITDRGSKLEQLATTNNISLFYIPKNVGGRYSVLSAVGLIPLAIMGINIKKLLQGAKNIKDSYFKKGEYFDLITEKALFFGNNLKQIPINVVFSYSNLFRGFNDWYIQLWAESLGKLTLSDNKHTGLTPIGLVGPNDQHSFLQLIIEGTRDKTVTFIKINDFNNNLIIPETEIKELEEKKYLNNLTLSELINLQADSTIEAVSSFQIPVDKIELNSINEVEIGELIFYFQLLTASVGQVIDVNSYDQSGVELGKKILKEKLIKLSK